MSDNTELLTINEKISLKIFEDKTFQKKILSKDSFRAAAFTHYLHSGPKFKTKPYFENAKKLTVPLENAEGRVSGEYIYAYPPGIPMIVPGEVFDKDTVSIIQSYIKGKVNVLTSAAPIQNGVVTALLTD